MCATCLVHPPYIYCKVCLTCISSLMTSAAIVLYILGSSEGPAPSKEECSMVNERYPARGGIDCHGVIRCHHTWQANKNVDGSFGCRGYIGGDKKPEDGLDCRFFRYPHGTQPPSFLLMLYSVPTELPKFNVNSRWDMSTTWGINQPTASEISARRSYRLSSSPQVPDPAPSIIAALRAQS